MIRYYEDRIWATDVLLPQTDLPNCAIFKYWNHGGKYCLLFSLYIDIISENYGVRTHVSIMHNFFVNVSDIQSFKIVLLKQIS